MKHFIKPLYTWYRNILRNSKYRWIVVAASLFYLVSPIDFVTDAIPVIGWLDDGVIATILVTEASQMLLEQRKNRKAKTSKQQSLNESLSESVS
ncbi:YkvA family protein [Leptolyngbya ohadii]|uniref:YkvA family protein n=1 Tax=Leptolyngbya ohadii TaxID=1962290 RepID=UPI000B59D1F1|nr:YkvA family protein [Leptolyngbya ohadii]